MGKLGVCITAAVFAATAANAEPQPCIDGSLADYMALGDGGCSVGTLIFSNFRYSASASAVDAPGAEQIFVRPSTFSLGSPLTGSFSGTGLSFMVDQAVLPERTSSGDWILPQLQMEIDYLVQTTTARLSGSALSAAASADELGSANVLQSIAGTNCNLYVAPFRNVVDTCALPGASGVQVSQRIELGTGAALGAGAAVHSVENRFSTPEPRSALLLGTGVFALAALAHLRRRV